MNAAKKYGNETDPRGGVKHGGPDADTVDGRAKHEKFNAQRGRDAASAGARGSNHIGQGSDAATNPDPHPEGVDEAEHVRNGNSEQESFDKKDDQDMDMKLDDGSDQELDPSVGAERKVPGKQPGRTPADPGRAQRA